MGPQQQLPCRASLAAGLRGLPAIPQSDNSTVNEASRHVRPTLPRQPERLDDVDPGQKSSDRRRRRQARSRVNRRGGVPLLDELSSTGVVTRMGARMRIFLFLAPWAGRDEQQQAWRNATGGKDPA